MTFATSPEPLNLKVRHDLAEPDFPVVTLPIPPVGPQFCRQVVVPLGTLSAGGGIGPATIETPTSLDVYVSLYVSNADGSEILERTFTGTIPAQAPGVAFSVDLDSPNAAKGSDLTYNGTSKKFVSTAGGVFSGVLLINVNQTAP